MLRRFESINKCGIFEDFRWDDSVPDFERINLIYGSNGAGKTSLARAVDDLGSGGSGHLNVSIRMSGLDKSTNQRTSDHAPDDEFDRVFVFGDRYIDQNHDFTEDTEIEAVLTLGKRSVEDEKRIAELRRLVLSEEAAFKTALDAERAAAKALEEGYTSVARGVVNALQRAQGDYRSNGSYSAAVAKRRFEGSHSTWALIDDSTRTADLATINSDERHRVETKTHSFALRSDLCRDVLDSLAEKPVSVVLDTLQQHPDATSWVEAGRRHHEGSSSCIYCGGGLSDQRKAQIEQHFSDEVERVQKAVDELLREVESAQDALRILLGDVAIAGTLFEDLREPYRAAHRAASEQVRQLATWLASVQTDLETKRSNVVMAGKGTIADPPAVDGAGIDESVAAHNARVDKHAEIVQQAAKRVEGHLLKESETKIAWLVQASNGAAAARVTADGRLRKYREEIAALEVVEGDPLPSAETMTRELARILGRNELVFTLMPDGKHYRLTRHGEAARELSTGERTAITLIHFLEHVKQADASSGKPIVIIDDPVSSLDSGAALGISTYIWSETVAKEHIEQVFLLTHNFELFRQWDIQIDGLPSKPRRGAANKEYSSNCYELVPGHEVIAGVMRRVPRFRYWPPNEDTRKKVRSSYHHSFIATAGAFRDLRSEPSMEKRLDSMLLFPNVMRRMLETFLAFKNPTTVGSFTVAMRDMGSRLEELNYTGDADALRLHLTRFMHSSSHDESPETNVPVSPDEIESVMASVFAFMHAVDREHLEGLCEVSGFELSDILVAPPLADLS